jgi:UDP-galactopyranose mutase
MPHSERADILVVGSGLSGATFARLVADQGIRCHVIDKRNHVGGNCFSYCDPESGIEVHKYGPHIFHTRSQWVWDFIRRFAIFNNFVNRVKAVSGGKIYPLPVNLLTINSFFGKTFGPIEAKRFIGHIRCRKTRILSFEDQMLNCLGMGLYETFFKYYSLKQWGVDPAQIPPSISRRVLLRYDYDDNYFPGSYQGIPTEGYGSMLERILNHKNISISLNTSFEEFRFSWRRSYRFLVFTGSLDDYAQCCFGPLPYRTAKFRELRGREIQGNAVINYTDLSVPFTRIHEHKWFMPERRFRRSIGFEEYSEQTDFRSEPFYPVYSEGSLRTFGQYKALVSNERDIIFLGRLAEYRYYDMDQAIISSERAVQRLIRLMRGVSNDLGVNV